MSCRVVAVERTRGRVLLSCSNSPSWPSRSRCLVSVVTHAEGWCLVSVVTHAEGWCLGCARCHMRLTVLQASPQGLPHLLAKSRQTAPVYDMPDVQVQVHPSRCLLASALLQATGHQGPEPRTQTQQTLTSERCTPLHLAGCSTLLRGWCSGAHSAGDLPPRYRNGRCSGPTNNQRPFL